VTLHGGITVFGKALSSQFSYAANGQNRRYAYNCIATDGFNSSCPPTGAEVVLGEGSVCIPVTHNGVVMFSAKTRIQGGDTDSGGTVFLQIKIDGNNVGNVGVQQLGRAPNAVSTRTFSASYLAAGNNRLTPGCHSVKVTAQASGGYKNLSLNFGLTDSPK
jgi:hypothetical protein